MLGLAVATQVLDGGSFARHEVEVSTSIACVRFAISQTGTTVHITISGFAGPHAPGPDGGIDPATYRNRGLGAWLARIE